MSYKDLITDAYGDLIFVNGDIKIDESDTQHVEHILIADRGQFRQFPLIGVGISRYYHGSVNKQQLKQSTLQMSDLHKDKTRKFNCGVFQILISVIP